MIIRRWHAYLAGIAGLALVLAAAGCSEKMSLPRDPNLDTFIRVSAKCAYIDRAFSHDPEGAQEELAQVQFPANWKEIVDSLITAHGSDPAFWSEVYTQIVERSRR